MACIRMLLPSVSKPYGCGMKVISCLRIPFSLYFLLTSSKVRFNLGLRAATQEYLDQNPWAWKDCI